MHGLDCQTPLTSLGGLPKQFFYEALMGYRKENGGKYDKPNSEHRCNAREMDTTQWCLGKKKAKQARMIYALPFLQKKYFTKCY